MKHALAKLGNLLGAAGLLYGAVLLIIPLAVVTVIRVKRADARPSRTWFGWLIMGRTAFALLGAIRH